MEDAAIFVKQYLEDLLSFFGLKVDVEVKVEDDIIFLDVPSTQLNSCLIGARSENLKALNSLLTLAVAQKTHQPCRINLDIASYKKQRADRLSKQAQSWIQEVKRKGISKKLKPMSAADRRIVHQVVNAEGLKTESVGEGSQRHVVILKMTTEEAI